MTGREERIALNEVLFRDLNERVEQILTTVANERPEALEIFCECGTGDCVAKLTLSLADYEGVRAHPERFIVAPDHDTPEVERVVEKRAGYWVVEKHEEEAPLARELDPRS
jgi:hypothetical protein